MTQGETRRFNEALLTIKNLESAVKHQCELIRKQKHIIAIVKIANQEKDIFLKSVPKEA